MVRFHWLKTVEAPRLPWTLKYVRVVVDVWKSGKPESRIGTGIGTGTGTGTGTGMGRKTYIKTGTTFILI